MSPKPKAELARQHLETARGHVEETQLHERGVLESDIASLLRQLNQARKDIWYEGDAPDFGGRSLEDVFAEVEKLVEAGEGGS